MVKKVIKKNGKKQKFDSKKIKKSVEKACKDCKRKISKKKIKEAEDKIINEVTAVLKKREMTSAEIRDIALKNLDMLDPAVVRAWIVYEILRLKKS